MSTMSGRESNDANNMVTCAMMAGMLAVCVFLAQIHLKRRRRQRALSLCSEEESIASSWSTIGLYNGIHEDIRHSGYQKQSAGDIDGERMHLLENSGGTLYT